MTQDEEAAPPRAAKGRRAILLVLAGVLLAGGAAAAGTLLGPKLLGAPAAESSSPPKADLVRESVAMTPIVVDTKDADGLTRHVKVALSIELGEGVQDQAFRHYVPRGREAVIAYLRGQRFEELTDPTRFEEVRTQLSQRVIEAVGDQRASRVLITDFVAQ